MDRKQLPKNFFKNNPLKKMSAALIGDFKYRTFGIRELNEEIETIVKNNTKEDRNERVAQEKEIIEHIDNAEALVSFMRKRKEIRTGPKNGACQYRGGGLCRKAHRGNGCHVCDVPCGFDFQLGLVELAVIFRERLGAEDIAGDMRCRGNFTT